MSRTGIATAAATGADSAVRATPQPADTVAGGWRAWLPALRFSGLLFLAVRATLFLVGWVGSLLPAARPDRAPIWLATPPTHSWHNAFTGWERFDATWFLGIATVGYDADNGSAAFFPLYPLAIRGTGEVLGEHWLLAAFMVSNLAAFVALAVLYRLTVLEFSDRTARRTLILLCLSPMGFYLFAPYTESLFLALTVSCFYALRRDIWWLAAGCAAAASATRSSGILLAVPLVAYALLRLQRPASRPSWTRAGLQAVAGSVAAGLGAAMYFLYWAKTDDWTAPLDAQSANFAREPALPWETVVLAVRQSVDAAGDPAHALRDLYLFLVIVSFAIGCALVRRVPLIYLLYYWASIIVPLTLVRPTDPLASLPRYYMVLFPMYWVLVHFAARIRGAFVVISVASGVTMILLALLFVAWQPVF